jgi:hypothetical protein
MPYSIGEKGSYGCSGYPVIKDDDKTVMGCHDTAQKAGAQIAAIEASENKTYEEKDTITSGGGVGIKNPQAWPGTEIEYRKPKLVAKSDLSEGDYVMGMTTEGIAHGRIEHIMWEGGVLGEPGTEYALESMPPENPAMSVRVYEQEDEGYWTPTAYSIGMMYQDAEKLPSLDQHSMPEDMQDEMLEMSKAEAYSPNDGMKAAARTAIKWREEGKAKGAGTPVGWGRARDIVAGRSMSLSVVKRMYSFFSRHEVDKKGKGFNPGTEGYPSKGRVMCNAWGGDAGFAWSRAIVKRNEDKALFQDFAKDYTRSESITELFKGISVGSMVSWNSSGGTARGKVTRIIRSGSYNVPGTEVTLNASEDDPVAVIRLYRNGEPTDTTVAHKLKTLRSS